MNEMNKALGIVYVEDDPLSREVMQLLLVRSLKFEHVTILDSSKDFLDKVAVLEPRPELFLLDIHLQPVDGFGLLRMLRGHPDLQDARIVALTASVMNEEVVQLRKAGFDGVLAKPIDWATFPNTLQRIIKGEKIWSVI